MSQTECKTCSHPAGHHRMDADGKRASFGACLDCECTEFTAGDVALADRYAETEQRLRQNVYKAALRYGTSPEDEAVFATALDRLLAYREARAKVERGCERKSKTGTCIDKGYQAWCWGCRAQATLDKLTEEAQ